MREDNLLKATGDAGPSLADTRPHELGTLGRVALNQSIQFYEEVVADYERVIRNRIDEIDTERRRAQQFLDWLGEILRLIGGKKDNEHVVDAVARFVQTSAAEAGMAAGRLSAALEAYRTLCDKHNIASVCGYYTPSEEPLPLGAGEPPCGGCGHPRAVHAATPTEAAS